VRVALQQHLDVGVTRPAPNLLVLGKTFVVDANEYVTTRIL
jgi:hypothetical protein